MRPGTGMSPPCTCAPSVAPSRGRGRRRAPSAASSLTTTGRPPRPHRRSKSSFNPETETRRSAPAAGRFSSRVPGHAGCAERSTPPSASPSCPRWTRPRSPKKSCPFARIAARTSRAGPLTASSAQRRSGRSESATSPATERACRRASSRDGRRRRPREFRPSLRLPSRRGRSWTSSATPRG